MIFLKEKMSNMDYYSNLRGIYIFFFDLLLKNIIYKLRRKNEKN